MSVSVFFPLCIWKTFFLITPEPLHHLLFGATFYMFCSLGIVCQCLRACSGVEWEGLECEWGAAGLLLQPEKFQFCPFYVLEFSIRYPLKIRFCCVFKIWRSLIWGSWDLLVILSGKMGPYFFRFKSLGK